MTRVLQDLAIANAATDLAWCADHDIDHIAGLAACRFPNARWRHGATNDEMAQAMKDAAEDASGSRAITWSDPTGEAAIGNTPGPYQGNNPNPRVETGDSGDDPTPPAIDSAIDLVYYSADELIMLCLDSERIAGANDRAGKLTAAIDTLHRIAPLVIQARDQMDRMGRNHLDLLVYQHISETAEWLRAKGEILCGTSTRKGQPVPQPGDLPTGCVSCARDRGPDGRAYFEPIDVKNHSARSMCRRCGDHTSGEGEMPPLDAVKYLHRTGKNWTWKILEEAKRAERAS